jgi:hypothetical protein
MVRGPDEQAHVVQWGAHQYSRKKFFIRMRGKFFGYIGDIFEKSLFEAVTGTGKNGKPGDFGEKSQKKYSKRCFYLKERRI